VTLVGCGPPGSPLWYTTTADPLVLTASAGRGSAGMPVAPVPSICLAALQAPSGVRRLAHIQFVEASIAMGVVESQGNVESIWPD
jgi:hypothetical protein